MKRVWRWVGLAFGSVVLAGLLFIGMRILNPVQMYDARHADLKDRYLRQIAAQVRLGSDSPNIVLILFDDLGVGDLGCYGSQAIQTPNLDRIAAAGTRFTHAYSVSPYCSASRAGLLTGRHPVRMGFDHVLQPAGTWKDLLLRIGARNRQLPAEEILLPEVLHAVGYRTSMVGKWHLGDRSPSLPLDRGFDSYLGLLFSNDQGDPVLWRDRRIVGTHPLDQDRLTESYTRAAIDFLAQPENRPFFLYIAHTFPHIPLHASEGFRGRSRGGLYGDVVEELDASVGRVMRALEENGLANDTLVLITSDNGPWFQGSSGGTRGRKMEIFEGGMRVPLLVYWPGAIPAGSESAALTSGLDLVPTVLELLSIPAPSDRQLDGVSFAAELQHGRASARRTILYTSIDRFQAWRRGRFKYHVRHGMLYGNPMDWRWAPFVSKGPWLFDLETDPEEAYDVLPSRPEVAAELAGELEQFVSRWRANPRGWLDSPASGTQR